MTGRTNTTRRLPPLCLKCVPSFIDGKVIYPAMVKRKNGGRWWWCPNGHGEAR